MKTIEVRINRIKVLTNCNDLCATRYILLQAKKSRNVKEEKTQWIKFINFICNTILKWNVDSRGVHFCITKILFETNVFFYKPIISVQIFKIYDAAAAAAFRNCDVPAEYWILPESVKKEIKEITLKKKEKVIYDVIFDNMEAFLTNDESEKASILAMVMKRLFWKFIKIKQ